MLFNASIRFTSCQLCALDPLIYKPLSENTWKRWERTMKGEITFPSGTALVAWNDASDSQRNLARLLDQLMDRRPFLQVDQFDGIYRKLKRTEPEDPEAQGILVVVVTPEPWQIEGRPSRNCSIDWLDSSMVESQKDVQAAIDNMLERLNFYDRILEIQTHLFNTEQQGMTELAYEIPIPAEFRTQPQPA